MLIHTNGLRASAALPIRDVVVTGGLWAQLQSLNHDTVIEHCATWMEKVGWIGNFDQVATGEPFEHAGIEFVDSEVYKLLEAMALEIDRTGDEALEQQFCSLVDRVAAAQDPSGYLHTAFGHAGQRPAYSDLEWGHELYCFGHLFQAAAARASSGRGGPLVDVAVRLADHVYDELGPQGRAVVCGHPEIEVALMALARATGEERYAELARLFVERRGTGTLRPIPFGQAYFQDDEPVRSARELRGHAVRALYLAAGAVDVAVEDGDSELLAVVRRQYDRVLARRTYVTGAMGSRHLDESFGDDFELPPDRAYAETCAAIASVMVAWRLLLATGEERYADVIERTLLNAVLCSVRDDGHAFFYSNTLHQRVPGSSPDEDGTSPRAEASLRAPWFDVSCCPTNVARTLAGVSTYAASVSEHGVHLHQYGSYDLDTLDASGRPIRLKVRSDYPHDGLVHIALVTGVTGSLSLRVPAWANRAATLELDGVEQGGLVPGRHVVPGPLPAGTTLTLRLPMQPRVVHPDPRIDAVRGQVVVEQGPLVLALEGVDLPDGVDIADVALASGRPFTSVDDVVVAALEVVTPSESAWPYGFDTTGQRTATTVLAPLRAYARWGNRGPTTMRVFLPRAGD